MKQFLEWAVAFSAALIVVALLLAFAFTIKQQLTECKDGYVRIRTAGELVCVPGYKP